MKTMMGAVDEKDIPYQVKTKIESCLQPRKIKLSNKSNQYPIRTYIQCVVANTRNAVIHFSRELVTAHKKAQKQKGTDHRADKKEKSSMVENFCNCETFPPTVSSN